MNSSLPAELQRWLSEMAAAQTALTDVEGYRPMFPDKEKKETERRRRIISSLLATVPEATLELAFRAHPKGSVP